MDFWDVQLVALDLDDTLLNSRSQLTDYSRNILDQLIVLGIEVVVASGRPYTSIPESIGAIPGIHYAVTSNGAAIHRIPDGERIYGSTLSDAAVQAILDITVEEQVLLETFIGGVAYADYRYVENPVRYGAGEKAVAYIQRTRHSVDNIRRFIQENCGKLDSIDIICPHPELKNIYKQRLEALTTDTYVTTSCRQLLEISDIRAGKEAALAYLCQKLHLQPFQCAAFGNAENDIGMLRFAGLGVAVKNAIPACLDAADLICDSNDQDGPAKVLEQIVLEKTRH